MIVKTDGLFAALVRMEDIHYIQLSGRMTGDLDTGEWPTLQRERVGQQRETDTSSRSQQDND